MKTLKKFMVMLIAGVLAFGSYLALPLTKIVAFVKAEIASDAVKVKKVPSTLDLNKNASVEIPFDDSFFTLSSTGTNAVYVYNGINQVVAKYNSESANYNFTPTAAGTYTIVYGYVDESNAFHRVSSNYVLTVTGKVTTFKFVENSEFYLPAKLPAIDGQRVNIPYPTLVLNDGTILNKGDEGYNVDIKVSNVAIENSSPTQENDHAYYNLNSTSALGIYEVRYTYGNTILIKNFEVVKPENFDTSKLSYTTTVSTWTEASVRYKGEVITLPTVTVKDANSNDVTNQTYNKITVDYIVNGSKSTDAVDTLYKLDGNKLTLYKDAKTDNTAYYEIKYKVTNYFGKTIKEQTFKITNVSSYRNTPTIFAVNAYTSREDVISSADYLIPSTFNFVQDTKDTMTIPAIFAEDTYGSTSFEYSRTIKYESEATKKIEDILKDGSTTEKYAYNEMVPYKFEKAGKYTLSFIAKSTLTGKTVTTDYTIYVVDGTAGSPTSVASAPQIKNANIPTVLNASEKTYIKLPTVVDKDEKNTEIDKRVKFVMTCDNGELEAVYENHALVGYNYTAPQNTNVAKITMTATNDNGTITTQDAYIRVVSNDENPASYTIGEVPSVTNDYVYLPTVQFQDENVEDLEISVTVYDPNGKVVTGVNDFEVSNGTVSGGHFIASLTGKYNIVYTAMDTYANTTSVLFVTQNVIGSTNYIQTGLKTEFPTEANPYETLTLPTPIFQLNGEEVDDVEYILKVTKAGGAYTLTNNNEFKATETGTYEFAYYVNDEQVSSVYTLTVTDTIKPELNVADLRPSTIISYADEEQTIHIPTFSPSDSNVTGGLAEYGIKITKDGSKYLSYANDKLIEEFYSDGIPSSYTFVTSGNGVYVVEYYATDIAGNTASLKLDAINFGDVDSPVITFNATIPSSVNKDETITFNASDIVVVDSSSTTYKVKVVGPDSKEITNASTDSNKYSYKLTSSGSYTLTITAEDGHGHTDTETKTITVTSEEYKAKINTNVLGIILIIASLLILGGVVFFFFKTRDRKPKTEKETTIN